MKKLSLMCMAALLLLAASCKKEKKVETGEGIGFRATTEAPSGNGKTYLDGTLVKWKHDDAILVCSHSEPEGRKFIANVIGDDATTADFDADGLCPEEFFEPQYTAFYPYNNVTAAEGVYTLSLPATQVYAEDGFAPGAFPMMAVSNNTKLTFKNICGMLDLSLYSETQCYVKSITLTTKGSENLHGKGSVTFDSNGVPQLGTLVVGEDGSTLTLNCGGNLMSQSSENPSHFCFVLPVGALTSGFSVTVTDKDGKTWTKSTSESGNAIVRSQICEMPVLEVTFSSDVPEGFVDFGTHVGGDSEGKPLYWAECNLGAKNPQDYGDYYVWGNKSKYAMDGTGHGYEITYNNNTYVFGDYNSGADDLSKYNDVDRLTELEPEDDCVWQANKTYNEANPTEIIRMPSNAEYEELTTKTYKEWTDNYKDTGIKGVIFYAAKDPSHAGKFNTQIGSYSTSEKHIFIPAAGHGKSGTNYISEKNQAARVWLSTVSTSQTGRPYAASIYIGYIGGGELRESTTPSSGFPYSSESTRIRPSSIRPVREGNN